MAIETQLKTAEPYAAFVDPAWFERAWWLKRSQVNLQGLGRGGAFAVMTPLGRMVIKHYHRGGLVAKLSRDQYFFQGFARSRSAREFALLESMRADGLPVPEPIAARTEKDGITYRCDLITRELPNAVALSELARAGAADVELWRRVGATIQRFHAAGIYHDDLNAQNILISSGQIYLIDFDRGKRKNPERSWQEANVARLLRSIRKNVQPPWSQATEANVQALLSACRAST